MFFIKSSVRYVCFGDTKLQGIEKTEFTYQDNNFKESKMKNVIRIIAVIQIILAVAFGFYANKIDTGVAKISRKFAASCGKTAEIIASHKIIYEKSATNIVNLQNVLDGAGDKTHVTADKFRKWGSWLQTPPEGRVIKMLWPGKTASSLGFSMGEMSSHLNDVSAALHNQAQILKEYEEKVLPQTREGFNDAENALRETKIFLEKLEQNSRNNVRMVSFLAGIIFLLNGIGMLAIAGAVPAGTKEA